MQNDIKILFIGDIVGKTGRGFISRKLKNFINDNGINFVIANGENLAGGFGVTAKIAEQMFKNGIDALTMGNHIWDNQDVMNIIDDKRVIRPINYHPELPGHGYSIFTVDSIEIAVVNALGRIFMPPFDCPFRAMDDLLGKIGKNKIIIIDFHAEATAEKQALGFYLDGKVSAVIGTHTHVQTADERILPKGTAYITDAGITGSLNGVIGFDIDNSIRKIIYNIPKRLEISSDNTIFNGIILTVDSHSKKAISIERIFKNEDN